MVFLWFSYGFPIKTSMIWLETRVPLLVAGGIGRDAPATQGVVPAPAGQRRERHGLMC